MTTARYVVGIDLGTTHCAVAYSPIDRADVQLFEIPQLVAAGETATRRLLPSFLYLPADGEFTDAQRLLPWGPEPEIVGEWAREQGASTPVRLVASAKSWICHGGVDRRAPILPWEAPEAIPKVSPFTASVRYLAHLRAAWDAAHPNAPLAEQEVVVTVPASFDGVANELTVEAAAAAGLPRVRLLEEPQAAFYDFIGAHEADLPTLLAGARLVLVVDVGGGTTDLTLVRVRAGKEGAPELERVAVGGHLMLGGDNMDAALAHHLQQKAGIGGRLDPTEWARLVQAARRAKETLLADDAPAEIKVSIQRRGSRLIGGTRTVSLTADEVSTLLLDGFVPVTGRDEVAERRRAGLTTLGLPYVTDPAIPRHVNAFLRRHAEAARAAGAEVIDGLPRPDLLLLNGGVFTPPALIERLQAAMAHWYGAPVTLLAHTALDVAVARGAARFALARHGLSRAIGGGAARAYYAGVAGADGRARAFCVAPKGMEPGAAIEVKDRVFDLTVDRLVTFPLFTYTGDRTDKAGALVEVDDELDPLPPLQITLKASPELWISPESGGVPVNLGARLTDSGALEVALSTVQIPPRRWRLAFQLTPAATRPATAPPPTAPPSEEAPAEPLPLNFPAARRQIERVFGTGKAGSDANVAKALRNELEKMLGPRGEWTSTVCRGVADALLDGAPQRGRSPAHELMWLRLIGWAIRPGFGARGDARRLDRLWALQAPGPQHAKDKGIWSEWWVVWRRVAGGLDAARQQALFAGIAPWLGGGKVPPGPRAHGDVEMIRLLGALERLSPAQKVQAGEWFFARYSKLRSYWPLGRLGARELMDGDAADTVPVSVAEAWLGRLFEADWATEDGAALAAVLLARATGDAGRDVDPALRGQVARRLGDIKAPSRWVSLLTEAADLSSADAKAIFGDALPPGLRLV